MPLEQVLSYLLVILHLNVSIASEVTNLALKLDYAGMNALMCHNL